MKRIAVLFVLLAAFLVPPVAAQAEPFTPELEADYAAALEWWGVTSPPQCSSVTEELLPTDPFGSQDGGPGAARATQPEAGWYGPCNIYAFEDRLAPGCQTKMIIRHEVGHLLGEPHSSDPESIMFPLLQEGFWCGTPPEYTSAELRREWRSWRRERSGCRGENGARRRRCFRQLQATAVFLRSTD